jgi:hypothetical protein
MLKQHLLKLAAGAAVIATLLGGVAFGAGTPAAAKVAPAQHSMACVLIILPPCI